MENIYTVEGIIKQIKNIPYYTDEEIKKAVEFANNTLQILEDHYKLHQENIMYINYAR